MDDPEVFLVRFTRTWAWGLLLQLLVLAAVVGLAWGLAIMPAALAVVFAVLLGGVAVVLVVVGRKTAAQPVALRLDQTGVTFTACPVLRWADVATVVIGPQRPRRLVGAPRLVASFRPQPGTAMPAPGHPDRLSSSTLRRRLYGTSRVLPLFAVDATTDDLASAVERLGGVPVQRLPVPATRPVLVVLLVGPGAVVLAFLLLALWYLVG